MEPLRLPPWLTYLAMLLNTRSMGTIPVLVPPVLAMCAPVALILCMLIPMPPEYLLICAQSAMLLKMPSMLSSSTSSR